MVAEPGAVEDDVFGGLDPFIAGAAWGFGYADAVEELVEANLLRS